MEFRHLEAYKKNLTLLLKSLTKPGWPLRSNQCYCWCCYCRWQSFEELFIPPLWTLWLSLLRLALPVSGKCSQSSCGGFTGAWWLWGSLTTCVVMIGTVSCLERVFQNCWSVLLKVAIVGLSLPAKCPSTCSMPFHWTFGIFCVVRIPFWISQTSIAGPSWCNQIWKLRLSVIVEPYTWNDVPVLVYIGVIQWGQSDTRRYFRNCVIEAVCTVIVLSM